MRKALTDKSVAALKPAMKRYEVRDVLLPGFGVRVTTDGQKSFNLSFRYGTKQRRLKLGIYPRVKLAEARKKANDAIPSKKL